MGELFHSAAHFSPATLAPKKCPLAAGNSEGN